MPKGVVVKVGPALANLLETLPPLAGSGPVAIDDMPDVVHEPYAFLLDQTGVEATVERSGYGKMMLTHLGERTRMTIKFRLDGRKWRWEKSHLFIDGEQQPLASGWDMYVSIYKDPDNGRRNHVPEGAKKAKIPPSQTVDEQYLPKAIAASVKNARRAAGDASTVTPTIVPGLNQYLVTVNNEGSGETVVIFFEPDDSTWQVADLMVINPAGYDISFQIDPDQMETVVARVLGTANAREATSFVPSGGPVAGAVSNSTMVRKASVFRI
jgi:hypothetical protein